MSLTEDLRIAGLSCLLRHAQDVMLSKRRQQEEQLSVGIADFGDLLGTCGEPGHLNEIEHGADIFSGFDGFGAKSGTQIT
jgi:hypothetical protein